MVGIISLLTKRVSISCRVHAASLVRILGNGCVVVPLYGNIEMLMEDWDEGHGQSTV